MVDYEVVEKKPGQASVLREMMSALERVYEVSSFGAKLRISPIFEQGPCGMACKIEQPENRYWILQKFSSTKPATLEGIDEYGVTLKLDGKMYVIVPPKRSG